MVNVIRFILRVFFKIFFRVEIKGLENVPKEGGILLCSNHIFDLDMFVIGYKLPRLVHYMAKEELFKIPFVKNFITWLGAFPVRRGAGDIGAIRTVIKLLSEGKIVGIFPEGTRSKGVKKTEAKAGIVLLAEKSGAPILPVSIKATYKPFSKIKLVYGKPFKLDFKVGEKLSGEEMIKMSKMIMEKIYALSEGN